MDPVPQTAAGLVLRVQDRPCWPMPDEAQAMDQCEAVADLGSLAMTYRHTPSLRAVAETQDTAVLTALADRLDIALNSIHNAAARKAVMHSRATILAAQKQLNP